MYAMIIRLLVQEGEQLASFHSVIKRKNRITMIQTQTRIFVATQHVKIFHYESLENTAKKKRNA